MPETPPLSVAVHLFAQIGDNGSLIELAVAEGVSLTEVTAGLAGASADLSVALAPATTRALPVPAYCTLGDLITRLEKLQPTARPPFGFGQPHAYRGYYDQLAFEIRRDVTVADMLASARSALGATYSGWKGGDYTMTADTPVWIVQEQGDCGEELGVLLLELLLANTISPTVFEPVVTCEFRWGKEGAVSVLRGASCACGWEMGNWAAESHARSLWETHNYDVNGEHTQ